MKHKSVAVNYLLLSLIGFSIFALALSYFQIRHNIRSPFASQQNKKLTADLQKLLVEARGVDTDNDGLSDFDELYKYGTSIYIADSDSDNFSDQEEITTGSNPLNLESTPYNKKVTKSNLEEQSFQFKTETEAAAGQNQPSSQEIRDFLVNKGGLSREAVDKISDKELLKLYNETKAETGLSLEIINQLGGQAANQEISPMILMSLEKMTSQEMRQLLISNGMDPKLLEKIDDQTLKAIFLEAVKQQATNNQ